ncbi:MAG: hypothetical protein ACOVT5_11615 [Armatimonadaceae bacterium]
MPAPNEIPKMIAAMESDDPAASKQARLDLESVAHAAASPGNRNRGLVADALLNTLKTKHSRLTRGHVLKLIGFVGERRHERSLSAFTKDPETGEDARMAQERIRRGH